MSQRDPLYGHFLTIREEIKREGRLSRALKANYERRSDHVSIRFRARRAAHN
jgi:hypothetical protein